MFVKINKKLFIMCKYRICIEYKNVAYSFEIESDFPLAQRGEFHPLICMYMKNWKNIDVTSGYSIESIETLSK
jgi:hypothetical protein